MEIAQKIAAQQSKIQQGNPTIELLSSCRIGNGIERLTENDAKEAIKYYENSKSTLNISFFIPASGSGSRMFGSLYDFIESKDPSEETIEFIEQLINRIEDFAFFNKLPQQTKDDLKSGNIDIDAFVNLILGKDGFNFGQRPKGLVPFHRYGKFIINPFQEHILQGSQIGGEKANFYFTINDSFTKEIEHSIKILREITGINFFFEFSVQDEKSNSIAFDQLGKPILNNAGELVTRPAGHGTLLENLNNIEGDLVFIRNIDNIQHQDFSENSIFYRKALAGVILQFQKSIFQILNKIENEDDFLADFILLNEKYDLKVPSAIIENPEKAKKFLNRPIRICGMVKNEGQPGGGPFWVKNKDGIETRQIVEKSQISSHSNQISLLIRSTHFNPVEIICAPKDFKGNKFNLHNYKDDSQYFIVNKTHQGKTVRFIEQPGLWNGGMAEWLTLFYEIENTCFSPVKTVLDLLKPLHRPN